MKNDSQEVKKVFIMFPYLALGIIFFIFVRIEGYYKSKLT